MVTPFMEGFIPMIQKPNTPEMSILLLHIVLLNSKHNFILEIFFDLIIAPEFEHWRRSHYAAYAWDVRNKKSNI